MRARCDHGAGRRSGGAVRRAADFVVLLAHKDDAERVLRKLAKRLGKYGLELHPDKNGMIDFASNLNLGTMITRSHWPRLSTSWDSPTWG
jgi:hypothetical protein